jgi:hypothetical protein
MPQYRRQMMQGFGETMTIIRLTMLAVLLSPSVASAGCEDSKAFFANEKPLPQKADQEIEVEVQESHEGGAYFIYLGANKTPERIIRMDFGLTGRLLTKLTIGAPNDIMISVTKQNYNVPFTEPGSMIVREETDFYFFCDGKLVDEPNADPASDYAKAAKQAAEMFTTSPEIATQMKATEIMPLTLK